MALVTIRLAEFSEGQATVSLTYDDRNLRVRSIEGVNNSAQSLTFTATRTSDGQSWSTTLLPGTTASRNLPNNLVTLTLDPDGDIGPGGWVFTCAAIT